MLPWPQDTAPRGLQKENPVPKPHSRDVWDEDRVLCLEKNLFLTATNFKCIVVKYSVPGCLSRTSVHLFGLKILSPEKTLSLLVREGSPGRRGMEEKEREFGVRGQKGREGEK